MVEMMKTPQHSVDNTASVLALFAKDSAAVLSMHCVLDNRGVHGRCPAQQGSDSTGHMSYHFLGVLICLWLTSGDDVMCSNTLVRVRTFECMLLPCRQAQSAWEC